jgi:predicted ATP-grasp superfamily ATP-dependent carboligase
MEKVCKYGRMVQNMRENGETVELTVKEHSITQMATFMRVSLKMIKPVVTESTIIKVVPGTKVNGKMILKKAMAVKNGKMVHFMKDTLRKAKKMAKESINGQMAVVILANGKKI